MTDRCEANYCGKFCKGTSLPCKGERCPMTSDKLRKDIEQADIFQLVFEAGSQAYCVSPNTKKIVDVELIKTIAELAKIKLTSLIDKARAEWFGVNEGDLFIKKADYELALDKARDSGFQQGRDFESINIKEALAQAREEGWNDGYAQGLQEGFNDIEKFSKGKEVISQALIKELEGLSDILKENGHCFASKYIDQRISELKGGGE